MTITNTSVISKPGIKQILSVLPSGIGLDIAKNHTGVVIWDGSEIKEFGFAIKDYDKTDYFAEYRIRRDFKLKLKEIVSGRQFHSCVVEDVYGGINFDTVRKLLALNTVIDELIFDRECIVDKFYRWPETKWLSYARMFYRQRGKLKSKVEIQGILEFLEYDFYLENVNSPKKGAIFFEDICDAAGMLLSAAAAEICDINTAKSVPVTMSKIKMFYVQFIEDSYAIRDRKIEQEGFIAVDLDMRNLEKSILTQASLHPDVAMCGFLPPDKLGVFGVKHKLKFYDGDEGYLIFYKK